MAVRIGKPAPEFEAEAWTRGAHGPKKVGLSQHRGKWIVLFFYPRDFTFICPTEIALFGAIQKDFERENGVVIGVSTDNDTIFALKVLLYRAKQCNFRRTDKCKIARIEKENN